MIVRVIVIDPRPRDANDMIVYQVPEKSRAMELLTELLDSASLEWTTLVTSKGVKINGNS